MILHTSAASKAISLTQYYRLHSNLFLATGSWALVPRDVVGLPTRRFGRVVEDSPRNANRAGTRFIERIAT